MPIVSQFSQENSVFPSLQRNVCVAHKSSSDGPFEDNSYCPKRRFVTTDTEIESTGKAKNILQETTKIGAFVVEKTIDKQM